METETKVLADRSNSPAIPKEEAAEPCEVAHQNTLKPRVVLKKLTSADISRTVDTSIPCVKEEPIPTDPEPGDEAKETPDKLTSTDNGKTEETPIQSVKEEPVPMELTEIKDEKGDDAKKTSETEAMVTKTMEQEEEELHRKTVAEEEEQKRRHEEELSSLDDRVREQRYKRLEFLLSKSNMYTAYLVSRMQSQQAEEKKKKERKSKKQTQDGEKSSGVKNENSDSKSAEEEQENLSPAKNKRGRRASAAKQATPSPAPVRRSGRGRKVDQAEEEDSASQSSQESQAAAPKRGRKRKATGGLDNYKISDYLSEAMSRSKKQKMDVSSESQTEIKSEIKSEEKTFKTPEPEKVSKDSSVAPKVEVKEEKTTNGAVRIINGETVSEDQPILFTGGVLRQYQVDGFRWLKVLYENGVNGILADEMGLGKTIQCIASIAYMVEQGVAGPFLVCGPLSTVPNWVAEFERFAPAVPVILYHGSKDERRSLRCKLRKLRPVQTPRGVVQVHPVIITSYEIIMNDRVDLGNHEWKYIIVDEGHRIKNFQCKLIRELKMYRSTHRLLLTGTPLQNNLAELWSLLNFLLPEIFDDLESFEMWFDVKNLDTKEDHERIVVEEQRSNILNMLHQILTPFMLRRLKSDVDLVIPPKRELLVYAPLTQYQQGYYQKAVNKTLLAYVDEIKNPERYEEIVYEKGRPSRKIARGVSYVGMLGEDDDEDEDETKEETDEDVEKWFESVIELQRKKECGLLFKPGVSRKGTPDVEADRNMHININIRNIMMLLRRVCNHPYLLEYPLTPAGEYKIDEDLIKVCGKTMLLDRMLPELKKKGHKVLIFSQMTTVLDIIQDYCCLRKYEFCRLDGSMGFKERGTQIASFNQDPSIFIFLLSTRAGGLGINLTAADTVIIYDSDWNPQSDLQAQDRCHRIGQTKPVVVYRYVTARTVDQKIVERAANKRKLEKMVIHKGKFKQGLNSFKDPATAKVAPLTPAELLELLKSRDWESEHGSKEEVINDADLERLLDRSDMWQQWERQKEEKKKGNKVVEQPKKPSAKVKEDVQGVFKVISEDFGFESNICESNILGTAH